MSDAPDPSDQVGTRPSRRRMMSPNSARDTLMTVLGEFVLPRGSEGAPRSAVTSAMAALGHNNAATRQALSRAARSGALTADGGHVVLTAGAGRTMAAGSLLLDAADAGDSWDGTWTILFTRNLPDDQKVLTSRRSNLLTAGLGSLGHGVWIGPRNERSARIAAMLVEDPAVEVTVTSSTIEHPHLRSVLARAWDLEAISDSYRDAITIMELGASTTDLECFVSWAATTRAWRRCGHLDPGVPPAAMGTDWPRERARKLYLERLTRWRPRAVAQFETWSHHPAP